MKKLFTFSMVISITFSVFAQSPQKMSYQCVVRNASGVLITNQSVGIRISILQGTSSGTVVYREIYNPNPQTNANGLVSIEIGGGVPLSGIFSAIEWASGPYFLKTETDPTGGSNYTIVGTSQLLSVPYAMYAKTAGNGFSGSYIDLTNKPILFSGVYNDLTSKPILFDGTWASLSSKPSFATVATSGNYNDLTNKPTLFNGTWTNITNKPTTLAGYGITDAMNSSHVANGITSTLISNWNTAYNWGNHLGLYKPNSYVPTWVEITGKPTFAAVAISGSYPDLLNKPILFDGTWVSLSGKPNFATVATSGAFADLLSKPTTLAGYGITNAMSTSHPANSITSTNITNWTTAYSWGNHSGLYRPITYVPTWIEITSKPTTVAGYGITDAITTSGDQTIAGNKTFTGTINASSHNITNIAAPVNAQDAATKAYVDAILDKVQQLQADLGVKDIDGNTYKTVKIGSQIWMTENLKTTKFNDGTNIPLVADNTAWINLTAEGYCWYNNDEATYKNTYGALYNEYAVLNTKLCPTGWNVPTATEWTTLITYLGVEAIAGGKLKEAGTTHWSSPNTGATNESGFTALPGGRRFDAFHDIGSYGSWWSSTEGPSPGHAWGWELYCSGSSASRNDFPRKAGNSVRCVRYSEPITLPNIITYYEVTNITQNTATSGGYVTSDGGATITVRGVCWSTSANPIIADSKTIDGTGTGVFTSSITGLIINTKYYVRAYATNSVGTAYGNEISFTAHLEPGPIIFNPNLTYGSVSDIDGNNYKTIQIGTQTWMAENLKTTKYKDGGVIPLADNIDWRFLTTPSYRWSGDNDITYKATYGALYNWYAASSNKLCPTGWHVPTAAEWATLINYLGGEAVALDKMRETGTTHWSSPNTGATNESGFTALPGGLCDGSGMFKDAGYSDCFWSASEGSTVYDGWSVWGSSLKQSGFSVRCLKDN